MKVKIPFTFFLLATLLCIVALFFSLLTGIVEITDVFFYLMSAIIGWTALIILGLIGAVF